MPQTLTVIYLAYMFIALYFLSLFFLTFLQNRREMLYVPPVEKKYTVSVLIAAHNEEKTLRSTVESVLQSDYENLIEVIIITNACTDNTLKIAKDLSKEYEKVKVLNLDIPSKANALNEALKIAKGELVAVVDADSYPDTHAIRSMVGFFSDSGVGAVTTRILVKQRDNFIRKMQSVEYKVIAFTRKLLGFLDAIYVTPGPLALYRKSALIKIKGFDRKNMTEDIEITWHLIHAGYKIRMSYVARSTSVAPDTLKKWIKQRIRWNIGGYQTILKYKDSFMKKGMLGLFILPFFSVSLILGVLGLGIFFYRIFRRFFFSYLSTKYSLAAQTAVFAIEDINLNPSVLNFLGIILFVMGLAFIFFALRNINKQIHEKESFFSVIFYSLVYILLRPIVLIVSLGKFLTGKYSWR